ncbi:unnamed protein product, partial [Discosporangium mesarthrocarpum]
NDDQHYHRHQVEDDDDKEEEEEMCEYSSPDSWQRNMASSPIRGFFREWSTPEEYGCVGGGRNGNNSEAWATLTEGSVGGLSSKSSGAGVGKSVKELAKEKWRGVVKWVNKPRSPGGGLPNL